MINNKLLNNLIISDHCQLRCFERRINDETIINTYRYGTKYITGNNRKAFFLRKSIKFKNGNVAIILNNNIVITVFNIHNPPKEWIKI
jgi:hypothetical protein